MCECVIISSNAKEIKHDFALRLIDSITLKGRTQAIYIYELLAENENELPFNLTEYQNMFAIAFAAYQKLQLDVALSYFKLCLDIYSDDSVARTFINRCQYLKKNPTTPDWNGVWHMYEK